MPKKFKANYIPKAKNPRDTEDNDGFYNSKGWRRMRDAKRSDNPFCEECEKQGRITPAGCVDHIIPRKQGGSDGYNNLQSLCNSCHAQKSAGERTDRYHKED